MHIGVSSQANLILFVSGPANYGFRQWHGQYPQNYQQPVQNQFNVQVPNYNQFLNLQNQFQNQLVNNFNQLSSGFYNWLATGQGGYMPNYNTNGGFRPQTTPTSVPTYPTVPARPTESPTPQPENFDSLIDEIFTKEPPTDFNPDLIDIRVDEKEEGKSRKRRETEVGDIENKFGLGNSLLYFTKHF